MSRAIALRLSCTFLSNARAPTLRSRRGLAMFEAELAKADEDVSVTRAALYIAMHVSSEIDTEAYMDRLEAWGRELQAHLPPPDQRTCPVLDFAARVRMLTCIRSAGYTRRMLLALNAFMFDELGFRGAPNAEWGTVENSCLNHVLDARTGIPLTMSIVYLDLARSAGLPMVGVNLPAHFVVRPVAEGVEALVDVYNAGAIIAVEDAEELLGPLYGQGAKIVRARAMDIAACLRVLTQALFITLDAANRPLLLQRRHAQAAQHPDAHAD